MAGADDRRSLDRFLGAGLALLQEPAPRETVALPRVEGFQLHGQLGSGGTSSVYLASDSGGRRVALKILRAGPDAAELERRLRAESSALARLRHPGFARLLATAETREGLPCLVMEYVPGVPLREYCAGLGLRELLGLFAELCWTIGHAHRHGILHRDLKPANLLVTAEGHPKVLDLGLARCFEGGPGGTVDPTVTERRMLTPAFASPEQLRGDPLSTATDIYSLGVLLYLLLTGRHPQGERTGAAVELGLAVLEQPPRPPSRQDGPFSGVLSGDLDAIVLRALRKEPQRRFPTVDHLAADVEALLDGRPVASRRGAGLYRASHWCRRHLRTVAGAAVVASLLLAFCLVSFSQEKTSRRARERTERTAGALVDLLGTADPKAAGGAAGTLEGLLQRAAEEVPRVRAADPELAASIQSALGQVYLGRGELERAAPLLEDSLRLRRALEAGDGEALARSQSQMGQLRELQGDYRAAEAHYREAVEVGERAGSPAEVARALNGLGDALHGRGLYGPAEAAFRRALRLRRRLQGPEHPQVAETLNQLAILAHERGDYEPAEALYRRSLELRRKVLGKGHLLVAQSLGNLGALLRESGRPGESEALLEAALATLQAHLGEDHAEVARAREQLALIAMDRGRYPRALALLAQAESTLRRGGPPASSDLATNLLRQGQVLVLRGQLEQAEASFRGSLALYRSSLGEDHPWTTFPQLALGQVLVARGQAAKAEPLLREVLRIRSAAHPAGSWHVAEAQCSLGACLSALGRVEEARRRLLAGAGRLEEVLGKDHRLTHYARRQLAALEAPPAEAGG